MSLESDNLFDTGILSFPFLIFFLSFFFFLRAAQAAYGSSQARG